MISVIIPAYNAQAYLRECLDSVLAQTYTDWEAIVIDDGSTDSTPVIAAAYAARDPRIRLITTENRGQSAARNVGLDVSKGDWITYLDSDDVMSEEALCRMYVQTADADIVVGQSVRNLGKLTNCAGGYELISGASAVKRCLYQKGINTSVWAKLYRRERMIDTRFPEGLYYEDILYCVETFLKARKVILINDIIYYYRDNQSSFINTFTTKRFDVLKITSMVENILSNHPDLLAAARDRRLSANFNIFGLLTVHDPQGRYAEIKNQCWQLIKAYRISSLLNHRVRLKNKLGILVSYAGKRALALFARLVY